MADKVRPQHAKPGSGRMKVWLVAAVAVLLVAVGAAFVLTKSSGGGSGTSASNAASETHSTQGVTFLVQPADGATDVMPTSTVSVSASAGRLFDVIVTGSDGTTLKGAVSGSGMSWQSTGTLSLKTTYTVQIDASAKDGHSVQQTTHFNTLVPVATLTYTVAPDKGLTVGVGQPIVLRFNHSVSTAQQTAMVNHLQVSMSQPVAGGWHWFSNSELHFRPENYWPTGDQVSLQANLAGFDAGNGIWAMSNGSTSFTIGDSHIATANVKTDQMTITVNGKVTATYPISAGRTIYPTMNGTHIDLYRSKVVHMVSSTVGIPVNSPNGYDEMVYWDVNVSDSGEFVHAAPWSLGAQGRSNVSHGCINLSPTNAQAFYNFSRIGDVIQVVGSPRAPSLGDHGTMDWTEDWSKFTPATVLDAATGQPADTSASAAAATTTVPATPTPSSVPSPTTTVKAAATAPVTTPKATTTTVPATTTTSW